MVIAKMLLQVNYNNGNFFFNESYVMKDQKSKEKLIRNIRLILVLMQISIYQFEFASVFLKQFYKRKYNVFLTAAVDPL